MTPDILWGFPPPMEKKIYFIYDKPFYRLNSKPSQIYEKGFGLHLLRFENNNVPQSAAKLDLGSDI
jgi:hypothetical protein